MASRRIPGLPVYRSRVEVPVEKRAQSRERVAQLGLLLWPHSWIRHHPVSDEPPEEKPLGQAELLRAGEEQFLRRPHLFLPLDFGLNSGLAHAFAFIPGSVSPRHVSAGTKYTSRTVHVALRRNLAFTFMPILMSRR